MKTLPGVKYLPDANGRRTAVVIDLRRHRALWEDFADLAMARARAREATEPLIAVKTRLTRDCRDATTMKGSKHGRVTLKVARSAARAVRGDRPAGQFVSEKSSNWKVLHERYLGEIVRGARVSRKK